MAWLKFNCWVTQFCKYEGYLLTNLPMSSLAVKAAIKVDAQ